MFQKIAIIGVGLIGGSLGLEIRKRNLGRLVVGYSRTPRNRRIALKRGLVHQVVSDVISAVRGADFIILCTPVKKIEEQLKIVSEHAPKGALVIDVGSTKSEVVKMALRVLPRSIHFVGAHPLAGTEKAGASAAIDDLFKGRVCLLTPVKGTSKKAIHQVQLFWKRVGSEVFILKPEEHDRMLALTSHLPHMVSYALMGSIGSKVSVNKIRRMAGGGLLDTTRISASSPDMWRDICLTNSKAMFQAMVDYRKEIDRLMRLIKRVQPHQLHAYFTRVSRIRKKLS